MAKLFVGVDLGGTNIKVGLVTQDGEVKSNLSAPTEADLGPDHVIHGICQAVRLLCQEAGVSLDEVACIGIGAPGPLDHDTGVIIFAPNLPGWRDIPLRESVCKELRRPVVVENDANVAGYAEYYAGAGRGTKSLAIFTLGTGIGGGFVVDGKMIRGEHDCGAEVGHMTIIHKGRKCGCENLGCLEAYASATSTVARMREAIAAGETTSLAEASKSPDFECKDIFDAAREGDPLATRIVDETAEYLAVGVRNVMNTIDPEIVVLTGGMIGAGEDFLKSVQKHAVEMGFERPAKYTRICYTELGGDAGIIGAALCARDAF